MFAVDSPLSHVWLRVAANTGRQGSWQTHGDLKNCLKTGFMTGTVQSVFTARGLNLLNCGFRMSGV